jgi:hypothetical protein
LATPSSRSSAFSPRRLALILTPVVRRLVVRYGMVDRPEARRVNVIPSARRRIARRPRSSWVRWPSSRRATRLVPAIPHEEPLRSTLTRQLTALLVGGGGCGARRDRRLPRPPARWQLAYQLARPSSPCISITFIANLFGGDVITFLTGSPPASRSSDSWMINSRTHRWPDGLSSGIAFIAAVTLSITCCRPRCTSRSSRCCASSSPPLLGFLRWNLHPASSSQ